MTLLDLAVGFMLLPAVLLDMLTQSSVDFRSENVAIAGRPFILYRARTREEWQQGFKNHEVARDEAMLFEFPGGGWKMFWMKDTVTPLDIIFLDEKFQVLKIHRSAQPCRLLCRPYIGNGRYVLELRAGVADELGIEKGHELVFR